MKQLDVLSVEMIMEKKDDLNLQLEQAAARGDLDACRQLVVAGADINVNAADDIEKSPLGQAIRQGDRALFGWLIDNGADVSCGQDFADPSWYYDETYLHLAASLNHAVFCEKLIDAGIPVDVKEPLSENTPLLCVDYAADNAVEVIALLLRKGANVNAEGDSFGMTSGAGTFTYTALDRAMSKGNEAAIELLTRHGGKPIAREHKA